VYQFKQWPRPFAAIPWMISQRDLVGYYIASFLSVIGANQLTLLLIAILGSAADVGALRAADVIMGPLNVAGYSLSAFAVPEFSRRQLAGRTAIRVSMMLSALLVSVDLVWGAVLLAMPDHVGEVLLGDTWANAQAVLPWSLAALVGIGISFGASTLMIARGFARDAFWTNALLAPSFLIFGIGGLLLWGAPGAAAGFALAQWVVAPVAWWRVLGLIRREDTGTGEGEAVHVAVSPS
jgi:O-antigen/teichoic acid export membrane protein